MGPSYNSTYAVHTSLRSYGLTSIPSLFTHGAQRRLLKCHFIPSKPQFSYLFQEETSMRLGFVIYIYIYIYIYISFFDKLGFVIYNYIYFGKVI